MKRTSTILAAGTLALGVAQGGPAAAHTERPIDRLHEIRAAYLETLAREAGETTSTGHESAAPAPVEKRLAQSWQNFPNFPNWGNWNNWANGWQNS